MAKSRVAGAGSVAADENRKLSRSACYEATARCSSSFQRCDFGFHGAGRDQHKAALDGQMTEFLIDTKNKRVRVRVELLGETEPIEVEILRYSLKEKGETTYITIEEATSSREWLTAALREFVVGQDLPIPAKAGAVLKLLT